MSRTDKDRPYEVRAADPLTKNRYWSSGWMMFGRVTEPAWEVRQYPTRRPPRDVRRSYHGAVRTAEREWARSVVRGDHEIEPPEGRRRHEMLWDWA